MHSKICRFLGQTIALSVMTLVHTRAYGQDIAAAEALFNKGVEEIKAGNYKDGCPAIAESEKLDPRPGTLFTLGECYARWGKSASAYVTFEDFLRTVRALPAAQQGRYADRVKAAEAKKAELKPTIPELTITLPSGAPSEIKVTRDKTEINGPLFGLAVPVDPGPHKIITELEGKPRTEETITLTVGEHRTFEVLIPGTKRASSDSSTTHDDKNASAPGKGRMIGMYAAFGVGAAGVILGGITGGAALSDKHAADADCPNFMCSPKGLDAVDHGRTMARVSTVGFVLGGAGIAAGVILLLTRPKQPAPISADVGVSNTGFALTIKGNWQ